MGDKNPFTSSGVGGFLFCLKLRKHPERPVVSEVEPSRGVE